MADKWISVNIGGKVIWKNTTTGDVSETQPAPPAKRIRIRKPMQSQPLQKSSAEKPMWQQMEEVRRTASWDQRGPQKGASAVLAYLSSMIPSAEGAVWLEKMSKEAWDAR
jgi:hypothetical protein